MLKLLFRVSVVVGMLGVAFFNSGVARAATPCTFTTAGAIMTLDADCVTDASILIPNGVTLNGAGHSITAVDPSGGHFVGAVVKNGGATAYVANLTVTTSALANVCDAGGNRLCGIMFEGASGSIVHSTVINVNQGPSGCQEGNAIEVRNAPFDGTHPNTQSVEIAHNTVAAYQKSGIVANGDVTVNIHHNDIGASATQANLAANSVQFGFGGGGTLMHNSIAGNSWCCADAAATAVLLYLSAPGVEVSHNAIDGNADVGIHVEADGATIAHNTITESGSDGAYDVGIGNYGVDNVITKNKVGGYDMPYENVVGGKNKTIPNP